jgi:hypothetical protein
MATMAHRVHRSLHSQRQRVVRRAVHAFLRASCVLLTRPRPLQRQGGGREASGGEHSGTELHEATWSINTLSPLPLAFVLRAPARHSLMKWVTRRAQRSSRAPRMPKRRQSSLYWPTCDLLICALASFVGCILVFPPFAARLALVHPGTAHHVFPTAVIFLGCRWRCCCIGNGVGDARATSLFAAQSTPHQSHTFTTYVEAVQQGNIANTSGTHRGRGECIRQWEHERRRSIAPACTSRGCFRATSRSSDGSGRCLPLSICRAG